MNSQVTLVLAIWGSVLSTVTVLWQVFLWIRSNARIRVRAEVIEGVSSDSDDYLRFELRNRGRQATTIEEIMLIEHQSWFSRITRYPDRVENIWVGYEKTMKLPVILQPGERWTGTCPLDERHDPLRWEGNRRRDRFKAGKLFYRVRCAHTDRLLGGTVGEERFFERM